jgi:prolyl 4-hydroxylase
LNVVLLCLLIFSFFFLFHSCVGKGTDFPDLGITVQPKKGRALIWPSIMDADPMEIDGRMRHQALPVEKGLKFGANSWIHMYVENILLHVSH